MIEARAANERKRLEAAKEGRKMPRTYRYKRRPTKKDLADMIADLEKRLEVLEGLVNERFTDVAT